MDSNYGATSNLEAGSPWVPTLPGNSTWVTAGLIVADVVAAGILGLSVAVSKIGWVPGAVLTVLLLAMNVHISLLMWRVRMHFPNVRSYMELVSAAFSNAPEGQRQMASLVTGLCQYSFIFAMLGIYVLSAGKALGNMLYSTYVCLPTWALLACLLILPFHATARRLGTWRSLILINVITICGTCVIPLTYMMHQGANVMRPPGSVFLPVAPFSFPNAFGALSTFTFAFTSQFMVVEIISEMSRPEEFPRAYVFMAAPFQVVAFLVVGIGGYYFIGDQVTGMIVDNIPFGPVFRLTGLCLLIHMVVAYLMKGIIICRAAHFIVDKGADDDDSRTAWNTWGVLALITAVTAWLIASTVPFFNELVDLIGASVTPICCYIIPIISYFRWAADFHAKGHSVWKFETFIVIAELALAVLILVFGTYYSIINIIDKWDTFGPPFACHCQAMWNTCQCSGTHVGMVEQCLAPTMENIQVQDMVDENFAWMVNGTMLSSHIKSL